MRMDDMDLQLESAPRDSCQISATYPLVMTNVAIEDGPFIVDFPIKNGDFQ